MTNLIKKGSLQYVSHVMLSDANTNTERLATEASFRAIKRELAGECRDCGSLNMSVQSEVDGRNHVKMIKAVARCDIRERHGDSAFCLKDTSSSFGLASTAALDAAAFRDYGSAFSNVNPSLFTGGIRGIGAVADDTFIVKMPTDVGLRELDEVIESVELDPEHYGTW